MTKMKTNSGCKKRFSKNAKGKIKRSKAFRRHHSWAKSSKRVRQLRKGTMFTGTQAKNVALLMPN